MDSLPLWAGTVLAASAAAVGLWIPDRRRALAALTLAIVLAPVLVAADNWNTERFLDLRDSPALIAGVTLVAAAIVGVVVVVLLRRPRLLPIALVALLPFRIPIDLGTSTVNLLIPLYAVLAAGLIAAWLRPERMLPEPRAHRAGLLGAIGPLLGTMIGLYALQGAYADDLSTAVENLCFFFLPFAVLFVFLAAAPWDRRLLRLTVVVLVVEGLVVALVGFGQLATGELFWNEKLIDGNEAHAYFRVNSLFFDPNIMGRYLAVTMVALAAVATWCPRREAVRAAVAFVILLAALVLTFSQTSMLALIAGLLALALARWGVVRAALAAVVATAALALVVTGLGGGGLTAETTGRTGLVSGGLEIAADRPVSGYGSGTFAGEFERRFGGGDGIAVESHTEPVTAAAEQGAIGVLVLAAFLVVTGVALWRAAGLGRGPARDTVAATVLAGYAVMLVHSLGYAALLTDPITWMLLALAVALPGRLAIAAAADRRAADRAPMPRRPRAPAAAG
jgi:O-antigen ligase